MRSFAAFTHKKMGGKLELGGPVVLFCLVVGGGFKLVPSAPEFFDLTVRPHGPSETIISSGKILIDFGATRRSEDIASNGEANFKGVPATFKGASVKVLAEIDPHKYKQEWQVQKLSGNTLELELDPAPVPKSHLTGTIIPPPNDWDKLRVTIEGQTTEGKVDELGRFDIPAAAADGSEVRLRIYAGQQLVYDDHQRLPGPVSLTLHR